jgi:hypothetical protein
MEYTLSLPVQELIRASERVITFATNHKGLTQKDFEAVLLCAPMNSYIKSKRAELWTGPSAIHERAGLLDPLPNRAFIRARSFLLCAS